jgi:hypothetical protein
VGLFGRRSDDALTAFANEQIKAAVASTPTAGPTGSARPTDATGAPSTGPTAAGWAPLAATAVELYTAVRLASTRGDLSAVAGRIGPELQKSLVHQQETMAATGKRRITRIDEVTAEPFNGQPPGPDDRILVVRYRVQGGIGEAELGDDLEAQLQVLPTRGWLEIWRLARPEDAPPLASAATCSNCGAPSNGLAVCRYCGTSLVAPATDYAVQTIEWLA